jgi:hypothetical protein
MTDSLDTARTDQLPQSAPGVIAAAGALDAIDGQPLHEHPDAYARVHAELDGALASIDDA